MAHSRLFATFLLAVSCCAIALAQDDCSVKKEKKFKLFKKGPSKQYPTEDIEKALMEYPEIDNALKYEEMTRNDRDERYGNDVDDPDWNEMCPYKATNVQYYGYTHEKTQCWVMNSLWVKQCKSKTCQYTFEDVAYHQCRSYYVPVPFWAYCPSHEEGPFILLVVDIPQHCVCRRYFCTQEKQIPPGPLMPFGGSWS